MKLNKNDTIGIIACSDGRPIKQKEEFERMKQLLWNEYSIHIIEAETIYQVRDAPYSGTKEARAAELMNLYRNPNIKAIFDISGGDLANEILPFLDFNVIRLAGKPFIGYSDLTSILNAIYQKTTVPGYNFLLQNIVRSKEGLSFFKQVFMDNNDIPITGQWLTNNALQETKILIGGNIRCLLKLAGTKYFPDIEDKIILLESLGGNFTKQAAYLAQYEQLGVFNACRAVILGQFTEAEQSGQWAEIEPLFTEISKRYQLPILKTTQIGHSANSIPVSIGRKVQLFSNSKK